MSEAPIRTIAITSGKGGVGKTHTTVNLGLALTRLGKRVLLLDADLGLANINVMLGFQPRAHIGNLLDGTAKLEDVVVHHESGLDIIPASSGIPELTNLTEEQRMHLVEAVESLSGNYDYLLIDTAAGIGDNVMYFNLAAEDVFVVVDPEPTSITDAYALIKVLNSRSGVDTFHVIANRVPAGVDGKSVYSQLAAPTNKFLNVSLKYLGAVQHDQSVVTAVKAQKPFMDMFPSSRASLDMTKVAQKVVDGEERRKPRGGLQFFFRSLVEVSQS